MPPDGFSAPTGVDSVADSDFPTRQKSRGAVFTKDVADSIRTIEFGPDGYPVVPSFEPLGDPMEAVHFGSAQTEYQRAKTRAVVFDLSRRGHLEFIGADRQKFLNGFCTADIAGLKPGEGCEAFLPNIKGKVLGHVFVFAGEDSLWLETTPDSVQPLMNHLARYVISEDVDFLPRSEQFGELYISGPAAEEMLGDLRVNVAGLPIYGHKRAVLRKRDVQVRRVDWLGSPGYLLLVSRDDLSDCWEELIEAEIRPAGIAVFHALRIQASFPLYGIDITDDNLAQEVNRTEQAVNFKKGCYLGQEPIARIDAMGHVNRELRTIKLEAAQAPTPGGKVTKPDGKEVGRVTSYAMLPDQHVPVALAYLHREVLQPGTELLVYCDGDEVPAQVL
jgi:tRNA-modifying protein YgfZ